MYAVSDFDSLLIYVLITVLLMLLRTDTNYANLKSAKFSVTVIMHFILKHKTDILITGFH